MRLGRCLCGRAWYESDGDVLFGLVRHCIDCRRVSGTGGVPVQKAGFRVTGETRSHSVIGGSGCPSIRHFRGDCGSLPFGTREVSPALVTIYVGSLDDPASFTPEYAQFTRDRPPWARFDGGLPEYVPS